MTNNSNMNDLLARVSPALLAGYEAKNLPEGRTLKGVNEEQRMLGRKGLTSLFFAFSWLVVGFVLFSVLLDQSVGARPITEKEHLAITALRAIALGAPFFFFLSRVFRWDNLQTENGLILKAFREAVEQLRPVGTFETYTESSVRGVLVLLAIKLLGAEEATMEIRRDEKIATEWLARYCSFELQHREEFEQMLKTAEKFGLTFDKADLFKAAGRNLKRTQQ